MYFESAGNFYNDAYANAIKPEQETGGGGGGGQIRKNVSVAKGILEIRTFLTNTQFSSKRKKIRLTYVPQSRVQKPLIVSNFLNFCLWILFKCGFISEWLLRKGWNKFPKKVHRFRAIAVTTFTHAFSHVQSIAYHHFYLQISGDV